MTLSNRKCQFLYKKKVGRTLLYEVSPYGRIFGVGDGASTSLFT